jgi:hypothetical protein
VKKLRPRVKPRLETTSPSPIAKAVIFRKQLPLVIDDELKQRDHFARLIVPRVLVTEGPMLLRFDHTRDKPTRKQRESHRDTTHRDAVFLRLHVGLA